MLQTVRLLRKSASTILDLAVERRSSCVLPKMHFKSRHSRKSSPAKVANEPSMVRNEGITYWAYLCSSSPGSL
jgi:hypothetical protein